MYTNTLYITIIVVFLTAFLYVLVYLVLRYTTGMALLKIQVPQYARMVGCRTDHERSIKVCSFLFLITSLTHHKYLYV